MEEVKYLKPPKLCDSCQSEKIEFVSNDKIYGKLVGKWPYIYLCYDCQALVGCHHGTVYPLGLMATKPVRVLRIRAHSAFDKIWNSKLMSREDAYKWLAGKLEIKYEECHISWLNKDLLLKAIEFSQLFLKEELEVALRRKEKKLEKEIKRIVRSKKEERVERESIRKRNKAGRKFRRSGGRKGN